MEDKSENKSRMKGMTWVRRGEVKRVEELRNEDEEEGKGEMKEPE